MERVLPGHAYIAPGDRHMRLAKSGSNYIIALDDTEPVNRHRRHSPVYLDSYFRRAANGNRIAIHWIALRNYHSGWAIHFHREGVRFFFATAHGIAIFHSDGERTSAPSNFLRILGVGYEWLNLAHCDL